MPVLSWAHSHYWSGAGAGPPEPELGGGSAGGYVPFQPAIIHVVTVGSGLGALQIVLDWVAARRARRGQ